MYNINTTNNSITNKNIIYNYNVITITSYIIKINVLSNIF